MKCPPHVADALTETLPNKYEVRITKGDKSTKVAHIEKQCRDCKLPVIILTEHLLLIIERDRWEVQVEVSDPG